MVFKLIDATEARVGTNIIIDGAPCVIRNIDISKTGKHGASKCRIEAIGLFDDKKRVVAVPGHERFEVPLVEKKKGQVLSISDETANVMDSDTFENLNILIPSELKEQINEGDGVEYWSIEGKNIIKRKI